MLSINENQNYNSSKLFETRVVSVVHLGLSFFQDVTMGNSLQAFF